MIFYSIREAWLSSGQQRRLGTERAGSICQVYNEWLAECSNFDHGKLNGQLEDSLTKETLEVDRGPCYKKFWEIIVGSTTGWKDSFVISMKGNRFLLDNNRMNLGQQENFYRRLVNAAAISSRRGRWYLNSLNTGAHWTEASNTEVRSAFSIQSNFHITDFVNRRPLPFTNLFQIPVYILSYVG